MFWSNFKSQYNVFIMGDSQSSILALGSHPKSIITRSTRNKVIEQALRITAEFPKIVLNFGWLKSNEIPADLNSKIHRNLLDKMNSQFWRHGPPVFLQEK